jgi:NifU-like protein
MWDYTAKVKDHFLHPRNVGVIDEPDGVGEVGSLACGDALKLMFKLDDAARIVDVKFQTFGCASAIASSSALTEIVKGMTVEEAEKVTNKHIADYLGGLPEQKMHCSVMGREALEAAIADYRGEDVGKQELAGEIVCTCFGVTEDEIERVIRDGNLDSVEDVTNYCKAGGGCGGCQGEIAAILSKVRGESIVAEQPPAPPKRMTNIQRIKLVEETIQREVRPQLQQDGGDIELIDVDGNHVYVSFRGACAKCLVAEFTMKEVVEGRLREFVSEDIVVEEIQP